MNKVPEQIQIGPYRYRVVIDRAAMDRENVRQQDECHGVIRYGACTITLEPENAPDLQATTLLHEVLHGIWHLVNLPALLDVLRRNPDLVRYLVEGAT